MIFTPTQYEALRDAVPKSKHRILIDTMLFAGMRYSELLDFAEHLGWFDVQNRCISIPACMTKTGKARDVHLTLAFTKELSQYLKEFKTLEFPNKQAMNVNLRRWSSMAGLDIIPTPKIFRKTWESWLLFAGYEGMQVALSQGHSTLISYTHYAQLPASLKSESEKVKKYTEGWGK